jgi:hypothetical protein
MEDDPPISDPVGTASDLNDSEMLDAIAEAIENEGIWNPTLAGMREDITWVKKHISDEPDVEYLKGEVRRVQIVLDEWDKFLTASVEMLKTPMAINLMRPMCRSLHHTQRLLDIAHDELRMGD